MLLGVIVSAILYGISLLQCLFYFTRASAQFGIALRNLDFFDVQAIAVTHYT